MQIYYTIFVHIFWSHAETLDIWTPWSFYTFLRVDYFDFPLPAIPYFNSLRFMIDLFQQDIQVPVCPLCNQPVPVKRGQQPDIGVSNHIDNECQSDKAIKKRKVYANRCSLKGCKQKEVSSAPQSKNAVCALLIDCKLLSFPMVKSCRNEQTVNSLS